MQRPDHAFPSLTQVGFITAAHGVRGQVKLRSLTDAPEGIFTYPFLTDESGEKRYVIRREGRKGQLFIVSIEGIASRDDAELLKGMGLYAAASSPVELQENQWLYSDLKGLEARLADGRRYGEVVSVYNFGAGDIIEIAFADGKTEMLPFRHAFVGEVRTEEGYVVVFPPEYLEGEENE